MYNTFTLCLKTGTESAVELVVKREKSAKVRTDVTVYVSNVCRREVKSLPDKLIFLAGICTRPRLRSEAGREPIDRESNGSKAYMNITNVAGAVFE